ncbi:PREDICTED: indole-3-acetic acid-amido synthetase GH3.17 [Theobroma cacao]|uniref:Indole-3-acetic acid-amido synthetase GH3.17 n=1 Tax=Theobroma cacao TaxID=3641 RepID=A0AB32WR47_THECC|nr:PREDICTED: indole-3-acetic acid-amido synthetase GH3.17 [Theobroma cacao]
MAGHMETMEYEDGLKILEELTTNAHQIQERVLEDILKRNAGTEYLRGFLNGQADKQLFKRNVPIVTYEDLKPYIDRIANGEPSDILLADPITQFFLSTGTSGGQPKLIPSTAESFEQRMLEPTLEDLVMKKHFDGLDKGKTMCLFFVKPEIETPSGLMAKFFTTSYFQSNSFKNGSAKICTSPIDTILCLDNKQSMYCQLLIGLLQRDDVVRIESIFASVFARSIKFLIDYWKDLCSNIRTGCLSDWITDPGCKNAVSLILTGPNPELADSIEHICDHKSWEGIIKKLWPNAKHISSIITGSMSQYISLLESYCGGIPLVSPLYASSEATFGINLKPLSKPFDVSYTFLSNMAYFEFLPVNKASREKAQELQFNNTVSEKASIEMTKENGNVEPVDLTNVKIGQCYEVVVTTMAGLYRYKVGDILKATGFYNNTPQFQFVERQNVVLSIDLDKTSEADLLKAITNAKLFLDPLGFVLTLCSSYTDTSSTPGRYVLFWELRMKESNDFPKLDPRIMEQCCSIVEKSFDFTYKSLRKSNIIAPLQIRMVKHGTFDALMDFYVSKGASINQYKTPSCIESEEAIKILNAGVIGKFFSPKTSF